MNTFLARFRDASGRWVERSTGCTSKEAAQSVLTGWEREEERIRAGVATRTELDAAVHMAAPLCEQIDAYLAAPIRGHKGRRRTPKHLENIRRQLKRIANDLAWRTLQDLDARSLRGWVSAAVDGTLEVDEDSHAKTVLSPRTIEAHPAAWRTFVRWLRREAVSWGPIPWKVSGRPSRRRAQASRAVE